MFDDWQLDGRSARKEYPGGRLKPLIWPHHKIDGALLVVKLPLLCRRRHKFPANHATTRDRQQLTIQTGFFAMSRALLLLGRRPTRKGPSLHRAYNDEPSRVDGAKLEQVLSRYRATDQHLNLSVGASFRRFAGL